MLGHVYSGPHAQAESEIRDATVTILGVGGSGGIAALALAASGVGHLNCVDPDVVELSNLSRQILYTEADIGQPKADSAVTRLIQLNSDIKITGQRTEDSPQRRAAMFRAVSATSAGLSGYLAAHNVISLLTGIPPVVPGQVSMVNLAAIDASQLFCPPPHPECDACPAARRP
jgi:hypothetical protein